LIGGAAIGSVRTFASAASGPNGGAAPTGAANHSIPADNPDLEKQIVNLRYQLYKTSLKTAGLEAENRRLHTELDELKKTSRPNVANPDEQPTNAIGKTTEQQSAHVEKAKSAVGADWGKYQRINDKLFFVSSPRGDVVSFYNPQSGKARSLRLTASTEGQIVVTPYIVADFAALLVNRAERLDRIAVFHIPTETWYPQELREPLVNPSPGIIFTDPRLLESKFAAISSFGRYYYAFSAFAKRWDVVKIPGVATLQNARSASSAVSLRAGSWIHDFNYVSGKWESFDLRVIYDAIENEKKNGMEPTVIPKD
jgi:hypothetical protein